jgi:hypothetical protein
MIGLPSVGNYMIKTEATIVRERQQIGVATKKFVWIHVE